MTDHFLDLTQMVPERIVLSPEGFAALQRRLAKAGGYDPRVAKVLSTPAPWERHADDHSDLQENL